MYTLRMYKEAAEVKFSLCVVFDRLNHGSENIHQLGFAQICNANL